MLDLIVVGAGPSGLSCAIEAKKAGLSVVVLEKGSLVDYIRRFPSNLVWFSTPELLEIGNIPFVVSTVRPTRVDTLNYYRKVVRQYDLDVRCFDQVVGIDRREGSFVVTSASGMAHAASNVALATGYFDNPNRLGVPGESLSHVRHYYHEPFSYVSCDVIVVGGRNSAVEAALDLFRHGARVTLVHRGERLSDGVKYWILPDVENRIKAGEIQALFGSTIEEVRQKTVLVSTPEGRRELRADVVFVLIGFRPDIERLKTFGVIVDPETLAPRFNPQTFETNVRGLYVAGSVVAGRNTNKVFIENGRGHGAVIVSSILARQGEAD
jgi:thioredoxin reductase (NADPH)